MELADAALLATEVNAFLNIPISERPSFIGSPSGFISALRDWLARRAVVPQAMIDELLLVADDLFTGVAAALRSSYAYIPDTVPHADQYELAKMTGHLGEVVGYLIFRDVRRATCVRTKVIVDDPNGERTGLDVLAFVFHPTDWSSDEFFIVEGKGTRNTVGGMRQAIVTKLRAVDARPSYYEFDRIKEELIDPRFGPNPSGLPRDELVRRISLAWWRLRKRADLDRSKLCAFVLYNEQHHPPTHTQLEGFGDIADDPRRIEVLLFPLPWFDETVRSVFAEAWTI